jgi:ArsR family transcriptional regulator, arsenate/arsenite/antimonite-responsive transcriptional repressor
MNHLGSIFKALGDPLRLRILNLLPLKDRCKDVYNVSELARTLGVSQPTISHHLQILRRAQIVQSRRMCHDIYYWINRAVLVLCAKALRNQTFESTGLVPATPKRPAISCARVTRKANRPGPNAAKPPFPALKIKKHRHSGMNSEGGRQP